MFVRVVKRRNAIEIEGREHPDTGHRRQKRLMLAGYAFPLGRIARKKNRDGMQPRAGKTANPVVGSVSAGIAKHLRACRHALLEFLREGCEGLIVHTKCTKPLPGEGDGDPYLLT